MNIFIATDWKNVNLETEQDPNLFGEALRQYCFVGNCEERGCYSTFNLIPQLKKVTSGKIYNEAKKQLYPEFKDTINVYYFSLKEKDCWITYNDPEFKSHRIKVAKSHEIVCAWHWDGDGTLYFRFNNRAVINTDCKCDYNWEWIEN